MIHSLYSQDQDMIIAFFEKFNRADIKEQIVAHLTEFPNDTLEYCKESSKKDIKRFCGNEILAFYEVNPKNKEISKLVLRGDRVFYKSLV